MTISKAISELNDGALQSTGQEPDDGSWPHNFQVKARQGSNVITDPAYDPVTGQRMVIGAWSQPENPTHNQVRVYQTWCQFLREKGFVMPSTDELVTASVRISFDSIIYAESGNDSVQGWTGPAAFPLTSSAWRDLEALRINFFPDWEYYQAQPQVGSGSLFESGGEQFLLNIAPLLANGSSLAEMFTTFSEFSDLPTKKNGFQKTMWINPSNKPTLADAFKPTVIIRSQQKHALNAVGSSSIQMTDGTAVFLRYDRSDNSVRLYYQRQHQTVAAQIAKLPTTSGESADYFQIGKGFQTFSITRDDSNNIYVVGMRGALQGDYQKGTKYFNVQAFKYTGNYAWTTYNPTQCGENSLDQYATHRSLPNNFSACWIQASNKGSAGQLVIMYSHRDGQWAKNQFGLYVAYAGYFRGDTSPGKGNGVALGGAIQANSSWRPANSSGTGLDAIGDGDRVRFGSFMQAVNSSDAERSAAGYAMTPATHVPGAPSYVNNTISTNSPHDPDGKVRMPWMGDSSLFYCVARHGHIQVNRKSDDTIYNQIDLTQMGLTGFPSREVLQGSQAWDIVLDSVDTSYFWVYYRDSQNSRLLRKVRWNYNTNVLDASSQFTPAPLGPSGSQIKAIRVPRQKVQTSVILVDVAMVDGALAPLTIISLRDVTMNKPPSAPSLLGFPYFNAIQPTAVDYIFNDVAATDYPTAHDVQVRRVDNSTVVYSPTNVAPAVVDAAARKYRHTVPGSTLSNDTAYQIRMRSYDAANAVGAWSDWLSFTTSGTGGGVVITQPAADNPPLDRSSVQVSWTYSNSDPTIVQNGYRVRVYNNDTNALFSDTAVVQSTATTRTVTGLWSDQQYRIEVTVLDSNGTMSGAGVRLVKASYNNPPTPTIALEIQEGFLRIRVTNPPPSGENPVTTSNQIARKRTGYADTDYVVIGTCPANGAFEDHTVASKGDYTYKARGVA